MSEVVRLVNVARKALGLPDLTELPKGVRRNGERCPLANALSDGHRAMMVADAAVFPKDEACQVALAWWGPEAEAEVEALDTAGEVSPAWAVVSVPIALRAFVEDFDAGLLPQYDDLCSQAGAASSS